MLLQKYGAEIAREKLQDSGLLYIIINIVDNFTAAFFGQAEGKKERLMTRLTEKDISDIDDQLFAYNEQLMRKTGMTLRQIACCAGGISEEMFIKLAGDYSFSVVPITSGQGIIPGFAWSVKSIISFLGCKVNITQNTDVAGIYEAVVSGANVIFMADDHRCIFLNLFKGGCVDNGEATGRGFAAALNGMAQGLKGKEVLVLGAGPVGSAAISFLKQIGALVSLYEIDRNKIEFYLKNTDIRVEHDTAAILKYKYLIDATPQGNFIEPYHLHSEVLIAAPGVPLGLSREAWNRYQEKVIFDPLQIGVAAMAAMALMI